MTYSKKSYESSIIGSNGRNKRMSSRAVTSPRIELTSLGSGGSNTGHVHVCMSRQKNLLSFLYRFEFKSHLASRYELPVATDYHPVGRRVELDATGQDVSQRANEHA